MKLTISLLFGFATSLVHAAKAPNFLIIYADDLGYTQTSVPMMKDRPELGHSLHQTPHLERLAARGGPLARLSPRPRSPSLWPFHAAISPGIVRRVAVCRPEERPLLRDPRLCDDRY